MNDQNPTSQVVQIVSGGQTGVDRGGLDAAIALGISHGGWCPRGRLAEDGPIPGHYELQETASSEYWVRTEQNVRDSDGTLIIYRRAISGGTELTWRLAIKHRQPYLLIDLDALPTKAEIRRWLAENEVRVLNVAGPRDSSEPGIAEQTERLLVAVLAEHPGGTGGEKV